MRTLPKWVDKIQDSDKNEQCVYDLCFNPDGSQLIVASGNRVLVYDTSDGILVQPLKGHKDTVYCVAYARNGQKFASGSCDKSVIIWSNKLEGLLKYNHGDAVQCLAFNPVSHLLVSCSISDFAFWSSEQKSVQKHKIQSRINCCSWTFDGQCVALGLGNGTVSIRNKLGEEKHRIEKEGNASIWALSWSVPREDQPEMLCVTDWNGKQLLSFYSSSGKLIGKERQIGFDALRVRYFPKGEYATICGTNRTCILFTRDGIKLGTIGEQQNGWLWCCDVHPSGNFIVTGCQDGTISYYQLLFSTVHGLYRERYAFRENMTDVIIQHLLTEQKVRIKCRDFIKKIAIYKHRLAVQLPERVVIYELFSNDINDMHYRVKEKITQKLDCNLLVVCTEHLVICQEKTLQCMNFSGVKDKEWLFESSIRYIKVVGGPPEQEELILGLKNGQVWEVHLDNSFPLLRVCVDDGVRCLDLNQARDKLAVVDEFGTCHVFDLNDGSLYYKELNTNSVAWNTQFEDMLAFSGNSSLAIKVRDFPVHKQKLTGFVVGFSGSKVFCLNGPLMSTSEIPLSAPMYQYIEKNMFKEAYKVACLGVTDSDWEELALRAIESLDFEIARLSFVKLQDHNYLELIDELQERQQKGDNNRDGMVGEIYAYQGKIKEAAHMFQKAGQEHKALTMYVDLRMFDLAQNYLNSNDNSDLIRQKADWAKNIREYKAAVDMYLSIGDTLQAVSIMGQQGWVEQLIDLGKQLDKADRSLLTAVAEHLKRLKQSGAAAEIYRRLGDSASVISLHVEAKEWSLAFSLLENMPQHKSIVYVPYANWLAENDKFVQAQKAFHKAGKPEEAFRVLEQLTENAVSECRFEDAGYYYWILSRQCLELADENENMLDEFYRNERLSEIYYSYNVLHKYLEEPFTSFMPEALFNISRFIMTETVNFQPKGVSLFTCLYCFSKQARTLGANKLAKQLLDRLQTLRVPLKFQEQVEIATIAARARPHNDPDELVPMCFRCSTYNPLAVFSNKCVSCGQRFVHSYVSFEILPLVEFFLKDGISDVEAVRLLEMTDCDSDLEANWKQEISETHQTLKMEDIEEEDPFTTKLISFESGDGSFKPIVVGRKALLKMNASGIFISKWNRPLKYRYYRNLLPDVPITMCNSCFKPFHIDDFELQVLQKGSCPFCRQSPDVMPDLNSSEMLE